LKVRFYFDNCFNSWQTKDFKSEGRLTIGSNEQKNMYIGVGLGGSSLDAKRVELSVELLS
jgi:Fragile site-associated protein C-terminus